MIRTTLRQFQVVCRENVGAVVKGFIGNGCMFSGANGVVL